MTEEPKYTSESGEQWVKALIHEARDGNPLVAAGVFISMEQLLKGTISERDMTPTKLQEIAIQLIGDMAPKSPEPQETQ